jgi:hypothetical protein
MKIVNILFGDRTKSEDCCGIEIKENEKERSTTCCSSENSKETSCC